MSHRPRPRCAVALVLAFLLSASGAPARAQTTPPPAAPGIASTQQLQDLADTLQDPAARDKLIAQIQALIATKQGLAPSQPTTPATIFERLSQRIDTMSDEILTAAKVAVDAPLLVHWLRLQLGDPAARGFWLGVAIQLALTLGAGIVAERLARLVLRPAAERLANHNASNAAARVFLLLVGYVVTALPVVVFAAAASLALPFTNPYRTTREVARVLISAILWARLILAAAWEALLSPGAVALYPLSEETRNYLYIWTRRFTLWAVYGFAAAGAAWWLGVPGAIDGLLVRATVLVLAVFAIVFVLQNRRTVADWLRAGGGRATGWRAIRDRLADTWHVLAVVYVAGAFGVYALDLGRGYLFLLRATVLTGVVLLAAGLLSRFIERASRRGFAVGPDLRARYPTLEARANRYLPILHFVAATIIYATAALALLQVWGVAAFAWIETSSGRTFADTTVTIAVVLAVSLVGWELFSAAIERYLSANGENGRRPGRSARVRTLLPLLRTTVLVLIALLAGLTVLSQLGVNIAPLLAGAGVVGLAVGFGSQALVKDVITGLFILAEDTVAVGDVVDVGKGMGVVESISIRTIRLRDVAGTLSTVPFSEVTTVRNMTREHAYALIDASVLFAVDVDRAIAALGRVADEMAADPEWSGRVLAPIEIFGLDRFTDSAQVVRARIKTRPFEQWPVQREFYRRMKKEFDSSGIEMPSMNQGHYLAPPPSP